MDPTLAASAAAAGTALIGFAGRYVRIRPTKREEDAKAAEAGANSAVALAKAYQLLVEDVRQDNMLLREEIIRLRERMAVLEARLLGQALGLHPPYSPDSPPSTESVATSTPA